MTKAIPHRELRNSSSEVLRQVLAGATIEVTNHGEVVAILVPRSRLGGSAPCVRRAEHQGGFPALPRVPLDVPLQDILDDLRGER